MGANLICHSVYVTVFPIVTEFEALIITSTVLIIALHVLNYNNIHGVVQKYHVRLKFLNFTMFYLRIPSAGAFSRTATVSKSFACNILKVAFIGCIDRAC